jgi:histidine triad (HIT) family protein
MKTGMQECLFCKIVAGTEPSVKILETEDFVVIKNKYPVAPTHVLVLSKSHREKKETLFGSYPGFWDSMFEAVSKAVVKLGLDKSGYKLVNNGAGYNHFEHEHLHILGGSKKEPGGST